MQDFKLPGSLNQDEAEDFLSKVDEINQQVKDLVSGKVSIEEFDEKFAKQEKIDKTKAELQIREKRERELKGKPGKGHQGGYKLICTRCFVEYTVDDIFSCSHCGKDDKLIT